VEHEFEPTYKLINRSRRTVGSLKKISAKVEMVYLACDPDREGEAIAWHLKHALGLPDEKVVRATCHEITRAAVREAFANPRALDEDLINAQQTRRILDRIVGYQLSPLISRKILRGLSAGRVQSVALRLVCEREDEVRAFQSEEYWTIAAKLRRAVEGDEAPEEFEAELQKLDDEDLGIASQEQADEAVRRLEAKAYRIRSVDTRTTRARSAPPFITSTLQQAASSRLGLTTQRVMRIAQQLYEGIEVSGQSEGLITYMRTDSTRVAQSALESVREMIGGEFGEKYLPAKPNTFRSPRAAQAAHEAIRPTDVARTPAKIKQHLSAEQFKLYELIWRRFVASQMMPATYEVTSVQIEAGPGLFVAKGRRLLFDGHLRVMPSDSAEGDQLLPALKEGEAVELAELVPTQHFTQPPPRYTEASLVRELERRGIGRPSTYAPTIGTLLKRNYVRRRRRALHPSELGMVVTRKLVQHFPQEMDYGFTSEVEEKLDKIEGGEADWRRTLAEFYAEFSTALEKARGDMTSVAEDDKEQDRACEKCGKNMITRFSRSGDRFLGCSGFPECDFTLSLDTDGEEEELTQHLCPECSAQMAQRIGRRGRPYLRCSAYPKCRGIMGLDREGKPVALEPRASSGLACPRCSNKMYIVEQEGETVFRCARCRNSLGRVSMEDAFLATEFGAKDDIGPCEECGGPMALKRSRKGFFLGCESYPTCNGTRNLGNDELPAPAATLEECEQCGRPMVLRWGRYGRFLSCSGFPRCKNSWRLSESVSPCPQPDCDGRVIRKVSKDGQEFYGCSRWPGCDHTATEAPKRRRKAKPKDEGKT
ncbi:MAG: type I DNA topoisomerase, partial [Candidatus Brocadiia bacterium]|jgi:DNA topoisomerase-1|nr:type I DNA topoisomerase [Candidatus Brocadiia bacterium]